jgi:hypothetical protein
MSDARDWWICDGCLKAFNCTPFTGSREGSWYSMIPRLIDDLDHDGIVKVMGTYYHKWDMCSPQCLFQAVNRLAFLIMTFRLRDSIGEQMAQDRELRESPPITSREDFNRQVAKDVS